MPKSELYAGSRIIEIRQRSGLNQEGFAQTLGIKRSHLSNIENDKSPITDRLLVAICARFGIYSRWLEEGIGPMENRSGATALMGKLEQWADAQGRDMKILVAFLKAASEKFEKLSKTLGPDAIEAALQKKKNDPEALKRRLLEPDEVDYQMANGDPHLAQIIRKIRIIFTWGEIEDIEGYIDSMLDHATMVKLQESRSQAG